MAKVQDYLEAAKAAIVSGARDRAIGLCSEVLRQYPKHLEAHGLLAEAYREQGNIAAAEELLICVLSADPENLIARWGLSLIHEGHGEREAALGQLRIALEVNPDHSELRKELVRLSGDRVKTTGGGLARLYLRGGHFDRAAAEFRGALAREPKRLDLLVGLAEALWRGMRDDEAGKLCRRILDDSPDCLKALLVAAFVEAGRGKPIADQETALWQAALALDPECQMGRALLESAGAELPEDRRALIPATGALRDSSDEPAEAAQAPAAVAPPPAQPEPPPTAIGPTQTQTARASEATETTILRQDAFEVRRQGATPAAAAAAAPLFGVQEAPHTGEPGDFDDTLGFFSAENAANEEKASDTTASPAEWGEWADLLDEEITLDPDAEARLAAALTETEYAANSATNSSATDKRTAPAGSADEPATSDDPRALLALAQSHGHAGEHAAAVAEFRAVLRLAPELSAVVAEGLRDIVRLDPANSQAHRALGDVYMKTGRFQQAIDEYNQALNLEKVGK